MKKVLFFFLCLCVTLSAYAGVRSLGDSGVSEQTSPSLSNQRNSFTSQPVVNIKNVNTAQRCTAAGFSLKECPAGYVAVYPCPENRKYFRDCCPQEYRFTTAQCLQKGLEPSVETCLNFHACRKKELTDSGTTQTENTAAQ